MDVDDEVRTIGRRIRRVRYSRDKSLRVIGGLAGMSKSTLSAIERGEQAPSLKQIVALANALQIAPSDLTQLPVPAPANGHTDTTIEAVRLALDGIDIDRPGGLVLPVAVLRDQVARVHAQRRACQFTEVATNLPALIRNLHSTLATGTDHAELLQLAVYLHVHVTRLWLAHSGAPADLLRRTVFLTRRLAQKRDEATTLGAAIFAVADALAASGASLAQAVLDSFTLPPTTADTAGLVGQVTTMHALVAVRDGRPGDVAAPMEVAVELAERFGATGDVDSLGFVFGPVDAGIVRICLALEVDEPDQAVSIARDVDPKRHPFPVNRAHYWIHYGRALAEVRGRRDDAVRALRTAEDLFPIKVRRDPQVRDVLATLLPGSRSDTIGQELRAMAQRAGLPV